MKKDLKQFLRHIESRGWTWHQRRSGHLRLDGPNGEVVFTGYSPSDRYMLHNLRRDIRNETKRKVNA